MHVDGLIHASRKLNSGPIGMWLVIRDPIALEEKMDNSCDGLKANN
jgi:hypothetical protein